MPALDSLTCFKRTRRVCVQSGSSQPSKQTDDRPATAVRLKRPSRVTVEKSPTFRTMTSLSVCVAAAR